MSNNTETPSGVQRVGERAKNGVKSFFTGEPGSAFWLVEQFFLWVRRTVASINAYLTARQVSRNNREVDDE